MSATGKNQLDIRSKDKTIFFESHTKKEEKK
jgi:hypothetical protein